MVVLLSPSPAKVATGEAAEHGSPAVGCGPGAAITALGPWQIEHLLVPYPEPAAAEQLSEFDLPPVIPAAEEARWLARPVESALGPWVIDRFLCPYSVTVAPGLRLEPTEQLAKPVSDPALIEPSLGPWQIDRLLFPYPHAVVPQRAREFSVHPESRRTMRVGPRPAHVRLVFRVAGMTRQVRGLVDDGARAARKAVQGFAQTGTPTLGGYAVPPRTDDAEEGLRQLLEALDAFAPPDDDRPSARSPWRDAPQTVSDPFALERTWTDADDGQPLAPEAIESKSTMSPPLRLAGFERVFPPSTGIAFLAALLLIPLTCSYAAGALHGYVRPGATRRQ
jgi:hypothetical protein